VAQRDLRDLTRYRTKLVQERAREVNRVQGVLARANIKLASVASDVLGVSGRAMLEALIAGQEDPATMAALATRRMRSTIPVLEQALTGTVRDHHRRLLTLQLAHIDFPIGGFSPPEGRLARGFKPPAFSRFLFQSAVKSAESF
jgi:transposase